MSAGLRYAVLAGAAMALLLAAYLWAVRGTAILLDFTWTGCF
jgi:hypothetical protein